ncbi:MAG: hypothetical protein JXA73_12265 [Acidobacteria bacterium]|nr:hypothetical protein [Acidobacteriota bacterium]
MPQLEKGGKWVYGWVVVRRERSIILPPDACVEYGFRSGDEIAFTRSSRSSGGFGIGRADRLPLLLMERVLAQGRIDKRSRVFLPPEVEAQTGSRLLVARGSRHALGFLSCGRIFEAAIRYRNLEIY